MPPSNSDSNGFHRLHPKVRRWIYDQGWTQLRAIQEKAIHPILEGNKDVLIMAPTAGGKTEAAFLPILSVLAESSYSKGVSVLYISPLKALINDQYNRLESLCEAMDITLTRWHGDASYSGKRNLLKNPSGILQITPESLESLFMNHGSDLLVIFDTLQYIVIDELHAFMGNVRGRQLQSLMSRLEILLRRRVNRIALSATIGDVDIALSFLRSGSATNRLTITSSSDGGEIGLLVKGYRIDTANYLEDEVLDNALRDICRDLFKTLRGSTNLVFANSRSEVEIVSSRLIDMCESARVPVEFFPHHGSLSADRRSDAEKRLKEPDKPTTVIATNTLELGIDIGQINSVAQLGAPPSVASMKQRLGRSGRRDGKATMRIYIREPIPRPTDNLFVRLHLPLIRAIAITNLMLQRWYEPPQTDVFDFSTLVQQTLSLVCQKGGARAEVLWDILCNRGAFSMVDRNQFTVFLRSLASQGLIEQAPSGEILLGEQGERLTSDYRFYAAFQEQEEYRLISAGKTLGRLPVLFPLVPGSLIIFAGRYWRIESVDDRKHEAYLEPAGGGRTLMFGVYTGMVHPRVRKECLRVLLDDDLPQYLDRTAKSILRDARSAFEEVQLRDRFLVPDGDRLLLFTWDGDRMANTLSLQLNLDGLKNFVRDGIISLENRDDKAVRIYLSELSKRDLAPMERLIYQVKNRYIEKHDTLVAEELIALDYGAKMLDREGTREWLRDQVAGNFCDR